MKQFTIEEQENTNRWCVISNEGVIKYYLDPSDRTKKADGTPSDFTGIDEQIMIELSVKTKPRYFGAYEPL